MALRPLGVWRQPGPTGSLLSPLRGWPLRGVDRHTTRPHCTPSLPLSQPCCCRSPRLTTNSLLATGTAGALLLLLTPYYQYRRSPPRAATSTTIASRAARRTSGPTRRSVTCCAQLRSRGAARAAGRQVRRVRRSGWRGWRRARSSSSLADSPCTASRLCTAPGPASTRSSPTRKNPANSPTLARGYDVEHPQAWDVRLVC